MLLINNDRLQLDPAAVGSTLITLIATDARGVSAEDSFVFKVNRESAAVCARAVVGHSASAFFLE